MRSILLCLLVLSACGRRLPVPEELFAALPLGRLALGWEVPRTKLALGEELEIRLWIRVAGDVEVEEPKPTQGYASVEGLGIRPAGDARWVEHDGERYWTRPYAIQWFRLGERNLPALQVRGNEKREKAGNPTAPDEGSGEEKTEIRAESEELVFEIQGQLGDTAGPAAEVPAELILDAPPAPAWPWILLGLGLLAAGLLVWTYRRRRRRTPERIPFVVPLPPDRRALDRLRDIERRLAEGKIMGEALVVEVSDVMRRFIEEGLGHRILARTSEEFLAAASTSLAFPIQTKMTLTSFLEQCDLVKFAAQRPSMDLCKQLIGIVRDFVKVTREGSDTPEARELVHG